jgi:DNA-directed RNA polymerase subunit alpha
MLQPSFSIVPEVSEGNYSKFIIEPLEKGYGQTLGVSLRRVLLSSIEGAAVQNVRIEGVQHQFTTLSGMKEDVVDFILNLKQLHLNITSEAETVVVKLDVKGPKTVTGKDIDLPPEVTLANPEQPLAVLADGKSLLNAEITIGKGRGYSLAADRPAGMLGDIPVDASFSPVIKVAYKIESTRVGRRTDFDKLIMEIWTDGTIDAKVAMDKAARILVAHFKQVYEPVIVEQPKEEKLEDRLESEVFKLTVEELDLPTRIANALRKGGYKTVKDLTQSHKSAIAKVKNLGEKSVDVVAKALAQKCLTFKDDQPETVVGVTVA